MKLHLKPQDRLLGTLRSYGSYMFWINCEFEAAEAFQTVKPLFDEESTLLEKDDIEKWEEVYKRIDGLNLELINLKNRSIH